MLQVAHGEKSGPIYLNAFPLSQNIELRIIAIWVHLSTYLLFAINLFCFKKIKKIIKKLRPLYFKKISVHRFLGIVFICTNKLIEFFFEKFFFSRTWTFFHDCKTTNLGVIFFHKKLISHFFSRMII